LETPSHLNYYSLKAAIRGLHTGDFYLYLHNTDHKITSLINNRTTEANTKIAIAALVNSAAKKLKYLSLKPESRS
jgi:hypothetical protein